MADHLSKLDAHLLIVCRPRPGTRADQGEVRLSEDHIEVDLSLIGSVYSTALSHIRWCRCHQPCPSWMVVMVGTADFLTSWITDPDGNRIEQTQPEDTPPR